MKKITLTIAMGLIAFWGNAQTLQWAKQLSGSSATPFVVDVKDVIANAGFVYVCGSFTGTVDFDINSGTNNKVANGKEGFIAKYNANDGALSWVTTTNSNFNDIEYLKIKFATTTSGINNSYINLLIKEGVSGFRFLGINIQTGAQAYSSPTYNSDVSVEPLNFHNSFDGKQYIVGQFSGTLTVGTTTLVSAGGNDAFIVRLTLAGNLTLTTDMASRYGGTGEDVFNDISQNTYSDDILAAGSFTGTFSSEYSNNTPYTLTSAGLKDGIVIQFPSNSTTLKPINNSRVYTFGSTGNDEATNIQGGFTNGGTNNYIVIGGNFTGTVDFDFSGNTNNRTSAGNTDAFISGFATNTNGLNFVFTTIEGGASADTLGDFNDTFIQNGIYYSVNRGNTFGGSFITLGSCNFTGTQLTFTGQMTPQAATTQLKSSAVFYIAPNSNDWFTVGNFNGTSDFDPDAATSFNLSSVSSANNGFIQRIKICTTAGSPSIFSSSSNAICGTPTTAVTLTNNSALNENFKWVWYSGSCGGTVLGEGSSISVTPSTLPATYFVRGEGGCAGNSNCQSITFVNANPIATVTQTGNMLSADQPSANTYQWIDCNNGNTPIAGATGQDFTPTASGSYAVIVSNSSCSVTSACTQVTLGLDDFERFELQLYPNPANDYFIIQGDVVMEKITLYNMLGQKVKEFHEPENRFDISNLANGNYIIEVQTELGIARTKCIIK